jgi:hypothetical protein
MRIGSNMRIEDIRVSAYTVPTETPESDGTLQWDKTTMILVEVTAGGKQGIGYSYADVSTGKLIVSLLADVVKGMNGARCSRCPRRDASPNPQSGASGNRIDGYFGSR